MKAFRGSAVALLLLVFVAPPRPCAADEVPPELQVHEDRHENGNLSHRYRYYVQDEQRVKHGEERRWYENGADESVTPWVHGRKHGDHVRKDKEGRVLANVNFHEGRESRGWHWTYYEKGERKSLVHIDTATVLPRHVKEKRTEWYRSGTKSESVEYLDGKKHGLHQEWSEKGVLLESYTYEKGERHGPFTERNEKDWIVEKGTYVRGEEKTRTATRWYDNGAKRSVVGYLNGKKSGYATTWTEEGKRVWWNEKGFKTEECQYRNDKRHGYQHEYGEDGRPTASLQWTNGSRHGEAVYFNEYGQVRRREWYRDGELVKSQNY